MTKQKGIDPPVVVVGAGLAGSLLALALARRGCRVEMVGAAGPSATALSYAGLPAAGIRAWKQLERCHGPLGLRPSRLVLHGWPGPLRHLPAPVQALPTALLSFGRVDAPTLTAAMPRVLERAGVARQQTGVARIVPLQGGGWRLLDANGGALGFARDREGVRHTDAVPQLVLAAGASCRALWPALPERLRFSWAGVIELDPAVLIAKGPAHPWLDQALGGRIVQPLRLRRPSLESAAAGLHEERWIVDAGLAPRDGGMVLGQITLVGPDPDPSRPPDPAVMEARLRSGLAELDPHLATLPGRYRQVPVTYCLQGPPLAESVENAPGLWVFTGFSGAFAVVPSLAESLADQLVAAVERHGGI